MRRHLLLGLVLIAGIAEGRALADGPDDRAAAALTAHGATVRRNSLNQIIAVTLFPNTSTVTDADFATIDGLPALRRVVLIESHLTDAALAHVATLPSLELLWIGGEHTDAQGTTHQGGSGFTDAGLAAVGRIAGLRTLYLAAPRFTDAGLAKVAGLTGLTSLDATSPGFTDAGLADLVRLTSLQRLNISGSRIHDYGRLAALPHLMSLVIGSTPLGPDDLKPLVTLPALRRLVFFRAKIRDDAVDHLARLPRLDSLDFIETPVAPSAAAGLRKALPTTQVNVHDRPQILSIKPAGR